MRNFGRSMLRAACRPNHPHRLDAWPVFDRRKENQATALAVIAACRRQAPRSPSTWKRWRTGTATSPACLFGTLAASAPCRWHANSNPLCKTSGRGVAPSLKATRRRLRCSHAAARARAVLVGPATACSASVRRSGYPDLDKLLARIREFPAPLHAMSFGRRRPVSSISRTGLSGEADRAGALTGSMPVTAAPINRSAPHRRGGHSSR